MIKLALKDLKLFIADRRAMILGFAVPIALISLFAFAFGAVGNDERSDEAREIVMADEDQTAASKQLIVQLDSLKEYNVYTTTTDSAETMVKKGREVAILIIHKGYSDSMKNGSRPPLEFKYDAGQDVEVKILEGSLIGKLMGIIGSKSIEKSAFAQFDQAYPDMDAVMKEKIHAQIASNFAPGEMKEEAESFITSTALVVEKQNSPGLIHAVSGTAIMMLLFSVVGMGASLLDEKEKGTLKKLLYSPLKPERILLSKIISVNLISILQLIVMFLFSWLAFGLDIMHHLPSLLLTIVAAAFACSSFGVLLASIAKSRQQIQGLSTLIVLVMSCIGGSMIPTFSMPSIMQKLSVLSVNYWSIQGFYDIFWRMLPITDTTFLNRILVLILIGLGMNLIALFMFRKNILKIA